MEKKKSIGLPSGPNEFLQDITQYISVEGYKSYSPDKNNPINIIESGSITMQDVDFPVLGTDNLGNSQMMFPENDYQFPGNSVVEMPMAQDGGNLTTQLRNFDYDKKRNKPFAKSGGSTTWTWKGKSYSGTLIPGMETETNRYARTKNGKVKTLPKAQTGNLPKHLDPVDLSKINEQNKEKINSSAYRDRLKKEYLNAHDIELNDEQLDGMVSDLNNQLTFGANEGNTGFYTQNVPDPSAAGFMMSGYDQIDASGNQVGPGSDTFDLSNPTRGNIYIARNASQKSPFNEIDNAYGVVMPGTSMEDSIIQHEINHRLNSLKGSPLSSAKRNPLYNQSYDYHNSFFDNAPDDSPFNIKFEDESFREYATQPFEIKSQKAQLEQSLLNAGIWDPSKGPFTQADVDKMVEKNITFNKGFDYLPQGLGINELVEGTVKVPGKLNNPMDYYTEYTNENIENYLGNKGYDNFAYYTGDVDMRNTSQRPFERIQKTLNNTNQGSKKWNEWSKKRQLAQNNYFNANRDTKELKDVLDGKNDMPGEKITALLKSKGIEVGPDGWYERKHNAAVETIYNEYKEISDDYRLAYDEVGDDRPKEEGLFGAFGPIKNFKGKKAKRQAVKRYNKAYGTNFKEWRDIVFEHTEADVSQEDKNVRKNTDKYTGYGATNESFDRELDSLNTILSGTGGYDTRREFYNNKFKLKGDFRPNFKGGRSEFNIDLANDYMSDLKNDPDYDPKKDVFNNNFVPPNAFDTPSAYAYSNTRKEAKELRERNRNAFNTALENNVWRDDLFTQAVLNLRANDRDAFIEYYNQDPDQKFETKSDIKKQKKLVKRLKSSMPDIRQFLEKTRDNNNKFIENSNNQYEIDQQQQLNDDELNNRELNQKISPNLIKFMNEVAMEDGSMPTELAQAGLEISDSKKLVDSGMNLIEEGHDATRPSKGFYENFNEIFGGTDCHKDRTCIQAVRDIYDNAGLDAGIPKSIYDNETFAENYKEYGYELIENTAERQPGDLLQFYYKNGAVDRKFHMGIYTGDNNYVGDGDPEKPMSLNNIYEYSDGTTKEPFFIYRKVKTKKDDGSLPEAQFGWNDFEKSKVGKFVDARGLRKDGEYIMNTVGDYFGYENTPEDARRMSLDATAMINPMPDFVNAADHAQQGEYTDAALYAGFGILPFSAGPLVKGVKSLLGIKPKFMSEIDWIKFNKSIPENKILLQEYNLIEETTKANKTWMKNTDGTDFMGTPEQFVQSKSSNFQKAYPDGIESVYRGVDNPGTNPLRSETPYGKPAKVDHRDNSTGLFSGDKSVAGSYGDKIYNLAMRNSPNSLKIEGLGSGWLDLHSIGVTKKTLQKNIDNLEKMVPKGKKPDYHGGHDLAAQLKSYKKFFNNYDKIVANPTYKKLVADKEALLNSMHGKDLYSTDDLAKFLEREGLDNIQLKYIDDMMVGDVNISNQVPGNYLKSLEGNNGMFDLTNKDIYKQKGGEPSIQDNTFIAATPEVIIDQASENNKKENQELGLSNILSYMVDTRGGTENLWTDLADNIAYHESGYEQRMDPKAIQRSNEYVDGKKTGNIIPGPGRGMFQFESKELNGSGSFTTAQKRYKNIAEATGLKLNENILNAKEATELSKQDQYTLFFANLIESKAVLKDYADGKLLAEDVWLKGHKNVSVDGNKESFRSSVKNAKELPNGIENGYSKFTLEELLSYKNGGEYNIFQDYVTGNYDNTNYEKEAKDTYDKLNRTHYRAAKENGMSPADYIMTNLMGHS